MPAHYSFIKQPEGSSKLAILFPGKGYTLDAPVMWYASKAIFDAGCDVIGVEYGYQANRAEFKLEEDGYLVDEVVGALENMVSGQYSSVVFIAKSMGTFVQNEVLQRVSFSVRNHVVLTPLRKVIPAIRRSENALVVVGGNDRLFVSSDVAQIDGLLNVKLRVIPNANHLLETHDYSYSVDVLKETVTLCGEFYKKLL